MGPSRLVHLELHTNESDEARAFYAEFCRWRPEPIRTVHGSYLSLELGGDVGGGIVECPTAHALWLPYVEVPGIEKATTAAADLGARVLLEPREGPAGWRSVIATRAGGEIALWQPK